MFFTWDWFKHFAMNDTDVDESFWGHQGITCNETGTETDVECTQRQDWNTMNRTLDYIKKNKPTLTFVHLGKARFKHRFSHALNLICIKYARSATFE